MAYADFVTAMMAFFLVMWLINTSPLGASHLASVLLAIPGVLYTSGADDARRLDGALAGNTPIPPVAAARAALGKRRRVSAVNSKACRTSPLRARTGPAAGDGRRPAD